MKNKSIRNRLLSFSLVLLLTATEVDPSILTHSMGPQKFVAITFDDGPRPVPTKKLMTLLEKHHVVGTFFIVGKMARKFPNLVRNMAASQHEIANHSWSHPNIQKVSQEQLRLELNRTRNLIQQLTGKETWLFRTPGSTRHYLKKKFKIPAGYHLVLWDLHSKDHQDVEAKTMAHDILTEIKSGDIVLFHNGPASTREALDFIIPELKSRGFVFLTVSELLAVQSTF